MADNSQDIKIHIVSDADVSGFKAAAGAGNELTQGTTAGAEAAKTFTKETAGASAATEEHGKKMEGSGKVLGAINKLVPELGHALHAAFMGPLGPIILVGMALAEVKARLADYNTELDKVAADVLDEHETAVRNLKAAWDEAQIGMGKYYAAMATAGNEGDATKKELDRIKAVADAQIEASKKVAEAYGKEELAFLRKNGASPEQIAAVEARQLGEQAKLDSQKQSVSGVGGLQVEQQMRLDQNDKLQQDAIDAIAKADAAKKAFASNQEELKKLRAVNGLGEEGSKNETFSADQKKLDALQKEYDQRSKQYNGGDSYVAGVAKAEMDRLQSEMDKITGGRHNRQNRIGQLEGDMRPLETAKDVAITESDRAQAASTTNKGRLRELPGEIEHAQQVQSIGDSGKALADKINERDSITGMTLGQMGAKAHLNQSQVLEIARQLLAGQMTHEQEIAGLKQLMRQSHMMSR